MFEEIFMTEFDGDDARSAGHHWEDKWADNGYHLLNSTLFTVPEIMELFR
jgi:hypothetical protein